MVKVPVSFEEQLESLLSEGGEGARRREQAVAENLQDLEESGVVLFGAGNLGMRTLAGLRKVGIHPMCFVDNNSSAWSKDLVGIPVVSPAEGARRYGEQATFVVTIWRAQATEGMAQRIEQLRQLGCRRGVPFLPLYWKYPELFLPHYMHDLPHPVYEQIDRVRQALRLMADDESRREYLAQMRLRLLGEFEALTPPVAGDLYFREELFRLRVDEVFVDCGAFDGDSLDLFLKNSASSFRRAIAFEPDPGNYVKLMQRVSSMASGTGERISLHQAATGKTNTRVLMDAGKGVSSKVGSGEFAVDCVSLDSILSDVPVTFIKMDIEGSELATLEGAQKLIARYKPILAISAYHQQGDLWNIPLLVHDISPDYSFHLRPHVLDGWDLVCYAIPGDRRS